MSTLFRCTACGCEWTSPGPCRACWAPVTLPVPASRDGLPYGTPGARPHRPRRRPTRGLEDVLRSARLPALVRFGYASLWLPLMVAVLVSGPPGGGKTTLCSIIALSLALQGIRVLWASAEEGAGPTTVERFRRLLHWLGDPPPPGHHLLVSDARNLRDVHQEISAFEKDGGRVVFVDSLTAIAAPPAWFDDLLAGPLGVVAIAHLNSRGSPVGGSRVAYDADVHLSVDRFKAEILKSRWFREDAPRSWAVDDIAPICERSATNVIPLRGEGS